MGIGRSPWLLAAFAALFVVAWPTTSTSWAQDKPGANPAGPPEAATTVSSAPRLNLIDRQRMLAEMLAKALCFIDLKVDKKVHRNQMSVAQYVFHSTLEHLNEGSAGLELAAEKHPELKKAIEDIKLAWVNYAEPLNSWTGGRWGKEQFAIKVYEVDEAYEKQLTEAIGIYRKVLVDAGGVTQDAAAAILAAGQQRTLTQQFSKQFCQALSGYKTEVTRENLKQSLALYKDVTKKFAAGAKELGLTEEQPGLVLDNIELARATFATIEPILTSALDGKKPTPEELSLVATANVELLRHWEKIVSTYVLLN
ncbi:MAG: type IV pili methyl-accepting chemotaxis transducer N-terminal domain-containing protein [Alphaproteobacteria bacterium]|nr:type IV pili methyl-accepting chemotaxis transducer N-terminal domain-containing protein [Alphaproteobacteria bacterium]